MRWLCALHLRAPDCSVILVANKCDESIENFDSTVEAVEQRTRVLLKSWQENRKRLGMTEITLVQDASRVSCLDGGGLPQVIERVSSQEATSARVPPAWAVATTFLDALREKRDPVRVAQAYLGLDTRAEETMESFPRSLFVTKAALWTLKTIMRCAMRSTPSCAVGAARARDDHLWKIRSVPGLMRSPMIQNSPMLTS